ncbi:uncharacterized protein LOC129216656 [Uloborus diversus]|uniref:uncharacterized protein LOC129216656 n=1 Tax=Uloborus diversus TaxID=327109 RepID=UPI0024098E6F|nr:uncharacterized protein LOC129216656 [Uloborus diversus]
MENLDYFAVGTKIFDNLVAENCLCSSNGVLLTWQELFKYSFEIPMEHKLDCQILCLSIARHTAEVYINQASNCNTVCGEVFELLNLLISDDNWEIFVTLFQNVKDMHLRWIFMKSMCSILYSSCIALLKTRVNKLLQMLTATLLNEDNLPILLLLSSLVTYNSKCSSSTKYSCQNGRQCSVTPYKEVQHVLYDKLSLEWSNFLTEFHAVMTCPDECRKKSIAEFLFLWNILKLKDEAIISKVLPKLISYIKGLDHHSSNGSVILSYFIEDDELLFYVMLSTLRIYIVFKKSRTTNLEILAALEKEANPHYVFIELLQKLGFDHNELISFLTSDETCFLLYLLQYLKLVINEWHAFVQVHMLLLHGERKKSQNDENVKQTLRTECDAIDERVQPVDLLESLKPVPHLVPYADSSDDEPEQLDECVEKSVLVLIHLKVALEKLSKINEFPFTVSPLISLLQECENRWLSKK